MPDVKLFEGPDELNTLHPASDVKVVADNAANIHTLQAVARLINLAANTGEHSAVWEHPLPAFVKAALDECKYTYSEPPHTAKSDTLWIIRGW